MQRTSPEEKAKAVSPSTLSELFVEQCHYFICTFLRVCEFYKDFIDALNEIDKPVFDGGDEIIQSEDGEGRAAAV